jgi:hypothetical protein
LTSLMRFRSFCCPLILCLEQELVLGSRKRVAAGVVHSVSEGRSGAASCGESEAKAAVERQRDETESSSGPEGQEQREGGQSHGQEGEDCCVCLCEFSREEIIRRLPCGHFFHAECVDHWLKRSATCPSCRWSLLTGDWMDPQLGGNETSSRGSAQALPSSPQATGESSNVRIVIGLAEVLVAGVVVSRP